jgi:lipopolysaccharide/colanic/teichoic acid biosynthesis glycosyltransferase
LDELPQFWNVLKGDMSLVGPRPLPLCYLDRYTADQARRLEVKPGITGWTAVKGRSVLEWEVKFDLDLWYVDHASILLDLKILWLTLFKVVKREGVSYPGEVNSKTFLGSQGGRKPGPANGPVHPLEK